MTSGPPPLPRDIHNVVPLFAAYDGSATPLQNSPSTLRPAAWREALALYPGTLGNTLVGILTFGALLGYEGPLTLLLSKNLSSADLDPETIDKQLQKDITRGRVAVYAPNFPYISSPLGLVPKSDDGFRRIHHLSHPLGQSTNDQIPLSYGNLRYTSRLELLQLVKLAGRGCILIKRDLAEAFRHIPIAPSNHWLMGFCWRGIYYVETCLSFGLRTVPYIFNMFGEALHWLLMWILPSLLLVHYLDDFIAVIPASNAPLAAEFSLVWGELTSFLGFSCNASKDGQGTTLECLGIEIDTIAMVAHLPAKKRQKALRLIKHMLTDETVSLAEGDQLTGFLNFCSEVMPLGRTFLRRVYNFQLQWVKPMAKRPLSPGARKDLTWWRDALPLAQGIQLLDDTVRPTYHLFTDACDYGCGGFWYTGGPAEFKWENALPIAHTNWFASPVNPQHININETEVIGLALRKWGHIWARGTLIIHTDNNTALAGFNNQTIRGAAMDTLRESLLLATAYDIHLHAVRVSTIDNGLADDVSRFKWTSVANRCPHWQMPLNLNRPPTSS